MPKIDKSGIQKEITKNDIENAIKANKNIKLIVLTSPTYEGIISNIKEIVEVAHNYNIPVLVDEAHRSHYGKDAIIKFDKEKMKAYKKYGTAKYLHRVGLNQKILEEIDDYYNYLEIEENKIEESNLIVILN